MSATENATHTVLVFQRSYVTCDVSNDLEIFENEYEMSNIVFSYSLLDPQSVQTLGEPAFEDVIHLNLFTSEDEFEPKEENITTMSIWMNVRHLIFQVTLS